MNPGPVSMGITVDLLLSVPLIHFLLTRSTPLPRITILIFLMAGLLVATLIVPPEHQELLHFTEKWILPAIEGIVVVLVVRKVREVIKDYNTNGQAGGDFYTVLKYVCARLLPGFLATIMASEIAVIYYGFIQWRKVVPNKYQFTYHRNSGTNSLLITLIFLIIVETIVMHLLVAKWSSALAWTLTIASAYAVIQIQGFLKSIILRPIIVADNRVFLRYGVLSETIIEIENIESINITNTAIEHDKTTRSLSSFGKLEGHNVVIAVRNERMISGLYGRNRKFRTLALFVDNKDEFKRQVDQLIARNFLQGTL